MSRPPNILLVISHDIGDRLGCNGHRDVHSPHLDAVAAAGVNCRKAFCAHPQCSPSRASCFTGRYPHSNGVMGLTHSHFKWDLHADEIHLAGHLQAHGYRTSAVGITHESRTPERLGFDHRIGNGKDEHDAGPRIDVAIEDLRAAKAEGRPFYQQVGLFEGHRAPNHPAGPFGPMPSDPVEDAIVPPFLVDDDDARREIAALNGSIRHLDHHVGRLLGELADLGLAEDTIVVFTSDHGIPFPRAKCMCYDPGVEIALTLRGPGIAAGTALDGLVSNVDLFPTLMDLAGLPTPERVQGLSFAAACRGGGAPPRDAVFLEQTYHNYCDPMRAVRTDRHKLIVNGMPTARVYNTTQQWRPATAPVHPADPKNGLHPLCELYDLERDPWERENLADDPAHAATRDELLARLQAHLRETADPILDGLPVPPRFLEMQALLRG